MMNQPTLFDLPPIVETEKPVSTRRWYILAHYPKAKEPGWYFVWKTHTNGGVEWVSTDQMRGNGGRKVPLLYKTYAGAKRMARQYTSSEFEIKEWKTDGQ